MSSTEAPTYGNWQAPKSVGIGALSLAATALLMSGAIVLIVVMATVGLLPAIVGGVLLAVAVGAISIRDRHRRTLLHRIATGLAGRRARLQGTHLYASGPLSQLPWGTCQLPGVLAQSRLTEALDSTGRPFAVLELPWVNHFSVVLATEPDGQALVDPAQVNTWVALWGQWLAQLGDEPGLIAAAVTVETAPDTGVRLSTEVLERIDPNAPPVAQQMLREVVQSYPAGSATIRAWVTLTFTGRSSTRKRSSEEVARDLASRLPNLTAGLAATGAGSARPVSGAELCEIVRTAYDPSTAEIFDRARAQDDTVAPLRWDDVGPVFAQADPDLYRHDGALSCSWTMSVPPRGHVHSTVLHRLLAPHKDIARKRVTLTYQPLDAATAARVVEADSRAADFRVRSAERPTAQMRAAQQAAHATAAEEARGAGLVNFALLVTATVTEADRLPDARAAVSDLAGAARLVLRDAHNAQDSTFAAALPLGLTLPKHLRLPAELRRAL